MIDWFTVVAQVINFFILLWLLKHFLYKRIIDAMDRREQQIKKQFQEIEQQKEHLQKTIEEYENKNKSFATECQQKQKELDEELQTYREQRVQEIRNDVTKMQDKWKQAIANEQNTFLQDLRSFLAKETIAISRQALQDMASQQLENSIVEKFLLQLQQLAIEDLLSKDETHDIIVVSTFEITTPIRDKIKELLDEKLKRNCTVHFHDSSDLICGIELKLPGHKISWSMHNYLRDFEKKIAVALQQEQQVNWKT